MLKRVNLLISGTERENKALNDCVSESLSAAAHF